MPSIAVTTTEIKSISDTTRTIIHRIEVRCIGESKPIVTFDGPNAQENFNAWYCDYMLQRKFNKDTP